MNQYDVPEQERFEDELDDVVEELVRNLPAEQVKLLNLERYSAMLFAATGLGLLLEEEGGIDAISVSVNPLFSLGAINAELAELSVEDCAAFARIAEKADHLDVYPLVDGRIRLGLTFRSLFHIL